MKSKFVDTAEAPNKWWAAQDAHMRSIKNSSMWTHAERTRAERMKLGLECVYNSKKVYIAYGRRMISVKVDNAIVADRKNLRLLEAEYAAEGITKKVTPQGVIYNIPRK